MENKYDLTEPKNKTLSTSLGNFETPLAAIDFLNKEKLAKKRLGLWFKGGSAHLEEREFSASKNSIPIKTYLVQIKQEESGRIAELGPEIKE